MENLDLTCYHFSTKFSTHWRCKKISDGEICNSQVAGKSKCPECNTKPDRYDIALTEVEGEIEAHGIFYNPVLVLYLKVPANSRPYDKRGLLTPKEQGFRTSLLFMLRTESNETFEPLEPVPALLELVPAES